jgi:proline racemase
VTHLQQAIEIIGCHAEGEVGDVIVGGVAPPPGATLWEQSRFIHRDGTLRRTVLNEPRGGVFRHLNLLVPPVHPDADVGFIVMEPQHTPPMSGSNSICVATVVAETGVVPTTDGDNRIVMEAPGGRVQATVTMHAGKATRVRMQNVPSFAGVRGATLEVPGVGTLTVDTAYGGDTFVVVDPAALGVTLEPSSARTLAQLGTAVTAAAGAQMPFEHPSLPDWRHYSFCLFASPPTRTEGGLTARHAVSIEPGKIDRSPTGTAVSARLALLTADGVLKPGERYVATSLIGSRFVGRVVSEVDVAGRPAVIPEIEGRAWRTGRTVWTTDPSDPWPEGYRLNDTWPDG